MKATIYPSQLSGFVSAPPSKSAMQRACALALLCKGKTTITHPGISNDDKAALSIIQALGATIASATTEQICIESKGVQPMNNKIHCGESGLSMRMFTPLVALSSKEIIVMGEGSLNTRPMNFFDEIFPALDVTIKSQAGHLPLHIQGALQAKNITIDGSLSSQFLTGLLFAFAATEKKETIIITVKDLKSKPYIDLSLSLLHHFGIAIQHDQYKQFFFTPEQQFSPVNTYHVEGDWSGGAFLLVAGAINGSVSVTDLDLMSSQGDKKIMEAIRNAGANIVFTNNTICVSPNQLNAFEFDATDCPDLFPPLVALAVRCQGVTKLKGVHRLQFKESNRGLTLQSEFQKLGYQIHLQEDEMFIEGSTKKPKGNVIVNSHHDHRIAMALTLAALNCEEKIDIEHAEAIDKSYPNFYADMQQLGCQIQLT